MTGGNLRIVVVEDNDDHYHLLERQLSRGLTHWNIKVDRATSLREAQSVVTTRRPDLLFLDLGLPDSTPSETLSHGVALFPEFPVIVMTSVDNDEIGPEAIQHGAQDYLAKDSATAEIIARAVSHALERFRIHQELERRNLALGAFAHTLAHEFRTPLQPVVTTLGLISEKLSEDLPPRLRGLVEISRGSMAHLTKLVDELLEIAESEVRMIDDLVDLGELVEEVVGSLRLGDTGEFDLEVVGNLPQIRGSHTQLRQLVENLFSNSLRYAHPDRPMRISIHARDGLPGNRVAIDFSDNGKGIKADHLGKVFEPFFRGDRESPIRGTGLGLFFCRLVIERHGGSLAVKSVEGEGTTFTLALPVAEEFLSR